jgi:phage tail-like protein
MSTTADRAPVRYATLRSGATWLAPTKLDGLAIESNGDIVLGRVPAVEPASLRAPSRAAPAGLAIGPDCALYLCDADAGRVLHLRLDCGPVPPGTADCAVSVDAPTGICIGPHDWLFVTDERGEQVLVYTTALEIRGRWDLTGRRPTGIAFDGEGLVVVDAKSGTVLRFDPDGRRDAAFTSRFALPSTCGAPLAIAADPSGTVYVGCASTPGILRYARSGASAGTPLARDSTAQALAVAGSVLYLADVSTGEIQLFALPDGTSLGHVVGFRGPVAGLAVDRGGVVYVKAGPKIEFVVAHPARAHRSRGTLMVESLDAGKSASWDRLATYADVSTAGDVKVEFFQTHDTNALPSWTVAAGRDTPLPLNGQSPRQEGESLADWQKRRVGEGRFLSIRVTVETRDPRTSPHLRQIQAETRGEGYLRYLPAVYSREDSAPEFLERLLALAKTLIGDLESDIEDLPKLVDPATAPDEHLAWLASWQGFEVPPRLSADPQALRDVLARLASLNARRGTLEGFRQLVEIEAGVTPHVVEAFRSRALWVLGAKSALGFDTGLPRVSLDAAVVDQSALDGSSVGPEEGFGRALFEETAHRFTVILPAADAPSDDERRTVRRAVHELKPAHTDCHVCFVAPDLRVGVQSRIGVDCIVAGEPAPTTLDEGRALDRGARLALDPEDAPAAVEQRARVGIDARLG